VESESSPPVSLSLSLYISKFLVRRTLTLLHSFLPSPYLSGEATYETIKGMQTPGRGTQACVKHYLGNEQERNRTTSSTNIDDRTMHEIYLHPFLKAVQAEVATRELPSAFLSRPYLPSTRVTPPNFRITTVMCSYNLLNNTYACENSLLLSQLLKHELGFQGQVLSDWAAQMSGVPSILAGLDMSMPGDITYVCSFSGGGKRKKSSPKNRTDHFLFDLLPTASTP